MPTGYRPGRDAPLTWVLHSLDVNHNQYGAYDPTLLQQLCEQRDSICATTLGRGSDGWYFDEAEEDFWSVWRSLGGAYSLSTRRTQLTGYSMGGYAAYKLGLAHPNLYARATSLAGPPRCGVSLDGDDLTTPAFGGRCHLRRWHGRAGEERALDAVPDRAGRARPAGALHVRGGPHLTRRGPGIGATTAWWTSQLQARSNAPGSLARVQARSHGLQARGHKVVRAWC